MGVLLNKNNNKLAVLKANYSIGRSKGNHLIISEPDISKSHASVNWIKDHWYIKDHSSNGTLLNGELIVHESRIIKKGDVLQFGKNQECTYILKENHYPSSYLKCNQDPEKIIVLNNGKHFPKDNPVVSFFRLNDSIWIMDNGTEEKHLLDSHVYSFSGVEWTYVENEPLEDTLVHKEVNQKLIFEFSISPDQENINLVISNQDTRCDLGQRVHNHLLFILAKEKARDIEDNKPKNISGWVSMDLLVATLRKELMQPNIDQYYINIMIYRIRKQFSKDLPFTTSISDLIERNNGKLRFRYDNISINTEQE